jgi:hypothetical protein
MPLDDGEFTCRWEGCVKNKSSAQSDEAEVLAFDTEQLWKTHMEVDHLRPMASELGDGPSINPSGASTPGPEQSLI